MRAHRGPSAIDCRARRRSAGKAHAAIICGVDGWGSRPSLGIQDVAFATDRLQIDRVTRIFLDLAAQAVDLHVDGALAAAIGVLSELLPRNRNAGTLREIAQQIALALGQAHRLAVELQLAARYVKDEIAHAHFAG